MKKKNLKNFQCHIEPETTLFQQEVDVIVALVLKAIELTKCNVSYGTFILDGQKKDGEAKCLIRFDLPKGHLKHRTINISPHGKAIDFALMAENAINAMLGIPRSEALVTSLSIS